MKRWPPSLPKLALPSRLPLRPRLPLRLRLPRPPLPLTALVTVALLVGPLVALQRLPRPRAQGLERLLATASLMQSFPPSPQRPVPPLWRQRLGDGLATILWRAQRRSWWQLWANHGEGGGAFLVLPATSLRAVPPRALPNTLVTVDDLAVLPPDPLSRQLLVQALEQRPRQPRGLARQCLLRLQREQAVVWDPSALGSIVGPVAPLLQPFQVGCLTLELQGGGLRWRGEAAERASTPLPASLARTLADGPSVAVPLAADLLLDLEGSGLEPLLRGLLERQMIREPLEKRYGFNAAALERLRRQPFRLRLRALPQGPYRAALELQLVGPGLAGQWRPVLARLREALLTQGLELQAADGTRLKRPMLPPPAGPAASAPPVQRPAAAEALPTAGWRDPEGRILGGWRWIGGVGLEPQLLLVLGPEPLLRGREAWIDPSRLPPAQQLRLRARPAAMAASELLPPAMPPVLRRAGQLWMLAEQPNGSKGDEPVKALLGALDLEAVAPPGSPPPPSGLPAQLPRPTGQPPGLPLTPQRPPPEPPPLRR
ncbi:MAG: hypothetical protein ACKOPN_07505 [Prochlorococcaceae cyanobacterium]